MQSWQRLFRGAFPAPAIGAAALLLALSLTPDPALAQIDALDRSPGFGDPAYRAVPPSYDLAGATTSACNKVSTAADPAIEAYGEVLIDPPLGFWLSPAIYDGSLYGPSTTTANWHFTQWLSPGRDLPHFTSHTSSNRHARVIDLGGRWEIAQNGSELAPSEEFAVFAEANQSHVYPLYRTAVTCSRPLADMEYLHQTIGFVARYEDIGDEPITLLQGGFITSLVLENTENGHKFFYQLELRPVAKPPCDGWWNDWTGPRWGYCDSIVIYGKEIPRLRRRVFYHLDLLPRLSELISSASDWLDNDLSHWTVIGSYHGSHVWGDLRVTGIWDSFSLHTRYASQE